MTTEDITPVMESFEGREVLLKTSYEGIHSTMQGTLRAVTFKNPIYRVSCGHGEVLFPLSKVTLAVKTDYINLIEIAI